MVLKIELFYRALYINDFCALSYGGADPGGRSV